MLKISNARAKAWRKCRNFHYYKYVEDIEPRKKAAPLVKGSMLHDMDDAWLNGRNWREVLVEYKRKYDKLFIEEREEYGDIIPDMETIMLGYIKKWEKHDLDYVEKDGSKTEHRLEVEFIPGKVMFVGIIDRMGYDNKGKLWLVEKKSFKQKLPKEEVRFTDLQTTLYYHFAPLCGFPKPYGVMWDYVRAKPPAVPQLLKKGGLSKRKNIDSTYETYLAAIDDRGLDGEDYADILENLKTKPDNFYRRVYRPRPDTIVLPLLRDLRETALEILFLGETTRARNLTTDCGWCGYYSLCQAELRGLDAEFIRQREYKERSDKIESQESQIEE